MSTSEVFPSSAEGCQVKFQLQVAVGKSSVNIVRLIRLDQSSSTGLLPGYLPNTKLSLLDVSVKSTAQIQKVTTKTAPINELLFHCGHLVLNPDQRIYRVLICSVTLSRLSSRDSVGDSTLINLNPAAFQYGFAVKSYSQVRFLYDVTFDLSQTDIEYFHQPFICSSCENRQAVLCCRTQQLLFCQPCSNDHHRPKLMQLHTIEPLNPLNTVQKCQIHRKVYDMYCFECKKLVCSDCGHELPNHTIKPLIGVVDSTKQKIQRLSKPHLQKIKTVAEVVAARRQQTQANYRSVRDEITRLHDEAINQLDRLHAQSLDAIESAEIDAKYTLDKLEWSKAFMKFQERVLKPVFYIQLGQMFENEFKSFKINEPDIISLTPANLSCLGRIAVQRRNKAAPLFGKDLAVSNFQQPSKLFPFNAQAVKPTMGELQTQLIQDGLRFFNVVPR